MARDEQPPTDMDLSLLSEEHQKPSLSELKAVWGLHRMAVIISRKLTMSTAKCHLESKNQLGWGCKQVERGIYRILIAGACMAGVYNAPRYGADPAIAPETFNKKDDGPRLQNFFAYQRDTTTEASEAAFGGFATWLRGRILGNEEARLDMAKRHAERRGRGRCCRNNRERGKAGDGESLSARDPCVLEDVDGATHADTHLVIWETMQMLWVGMRLQNLHFDPPKGGETPVVVQRVPVILFGEFLPAEFSIVRGLPLGTGEAPGYKHMLSLIRTPQQKKAAYAFFLDKGFLHTFRGWAGVLQWVHEYSGVPNRFFASFLPMNPLSMKMFDFLVQRYARARIMAGSYQGDLPYHAGSRALLSNYAIFANDVKEGRDPWKHPTSTSVLGEYDEQYGFGDGSEILETDKIPLPEVFFDDNGMGSILQS